MNAISPIMNAMTSTSMSAADLAAATPPDRNRYVDFIRVLAICVVVCGHWFLSLMVLYGDGGLSRVLGVQLITWLLQVMPLFFAVGGFSHARSLASQHRRGGTYVEFLRSRAARLLPPVVVFLLIWLVVAAVFELTDVQHGPVELAADRVTSPLWFIGVYLLVVLFAPATFAWHRRHGAWAVAVLALAAVGLDLLRYRFDVSWAGAVSLLVVWLAVHQLGYLWSDGTLDRPGRPLAAAVGGFGLTATLTLGTGWYPVLMVGLPGDQTSNMAPPNVALLAHAVGLTGLALLFRGPAERWLRRPRPWAAVALGNSVIMTMFCWHLTAVFLVQGTLMLLRAHPPAAGTAAWLAFLPLWVLLCAGPLVVLVRLFRWAERPPALTGGPAGGRVAAIVGTVLAAFGIFAASQVGLDGLIAGRTERVQSVPLPVWVAIVALAAGMLLLRAGRPARR
jgi:peptidoglycan/LPS O-acetylase OafA/YrhL